MIILKMEKSRFYCFHLKIFQSSGGYKFLIANQLKIKNFLSDKKALKMSKLAVIFSLSALLFVMAGLLQKLRKF